MSLSIRSRLTGTHPYLAWAAEYILAYAQQAGAQFQITSVNRTADEQFDLWSAPNTLAVAPGCSQHQYGSALDVWFERADWQRWWTASAQNFGLTTVRGDSVHAQLFPGGAFREWSTARGFCPDPRFPKQPVFDFFDDYDIFYFSNPLGTGSFGVNIPRQQPLILE